MHTYFFSKFNIFFPINERKNKNRINFPRSLCVFLHGRVPPVPGAGVALEGGEGEAAAGLGEAGGRGEARVILVVLASRSLKTDLMFLPGSLFPKSLKYFFLMIVRSNQSKWGKLNTF